MKIMMRSRKVLGISFCLAVGATLATVADADCYRYVSGSATAPSIKDSCVQQLGVPQIFVRMTEDGYELLIPTSSEDINSTPFRRAAAALEWLQSGTNMDATTTVVDALVSDPEVILPLGTSRIEQINYTLATWLNTSGATTLIANRAIDPNQPLAGGNCPAMHPNPCTACMWFFCWPDWTGLGCDCEGLGTTCCVIGRRLAPPPDYVP